MEDTKKVRGKGYQPSVRINWTKFRFDLKEYRDYNNVSYRDFSEILGINFATLSKIEIGKSKCSAETFVTIVYRMGKNLEDYIMIKKIENV